MNIVIIYLLVCVVPRDPPETHQEATLVDFCLKDQLMVFSTLILSILELAAQIWKYHSFGLFCQKPAQMGFLWISRSIIIDRPQTLLFYHIEP